MAAAQRSRVLLVEDEFLLCDMLTEMLAEYGFEVHAVANARDALQHLTCGSPCDILLTDINLPGSIEQHYHIDGLYTDDFLICNVAVIDTDLVNGAIDLLPGTNRQFIPYWKYAVVIRP